MKKSFLFSLLVLLIGCGGAGNKSHNGKQNENVTSDSDVLPIYIGTYGNHCYTAEFDAMSKRVAVTGAVDAIDPTYLCTGEGVLYSVSEHQGHPGVYSFRDNVQTGYCDEIGESPCHILGFGDGKYVATANYSSGSISVFKSEDGVIVKHLQDLAYENHSHIHQLKFIPGTSWLLATDLGDDCIHILKASDGDEPLTDAGTVREGFPKGSGPRHMEFSPEKQLLYCICELSDELIVFHYELNEAGVPEFEFLNIQRANEVFAGGSADIHMHPCGKFLYTSHRLDNEGVALFQIGEDGMPVKTGYFLTGSHPRNFMITPDGRFMLVACRDSASVEVYSIDPGNGQLTKLSETVFEEDKPVCLITAQLLQSK